jgi:hypothetical protein
MLVTATAIALFRYTAELDVAVRHWAPSAPPSGEAPPLVRPPILAFTEPAPPVRDTRADRPAKTSASNSAQREQPLQKGKDGGAKQTAAPDAVPSPQTLPSGPLVASAAPRNDRASETVPASTPPSSADMRPSLDVVGRLRVNSRREAERDLAALVARVGGTTVSRRRGDKITVMEAVVPNPSYDKFAEGLGRIGSWQIEAGRSRLPDPVRMTVRLTE